MVQKVAHAKGNGIKKTAKLQPQFIPKSMEDRYKVHARKRITQNMGIHQKNDQTTGRVKLTVFRAVVKIPRSRFFVHQLSLLRCVFTFYSRLKHERKNVLRVGLVPFLHWFCAWPCALALRLVLCHFHTWFYALPCTSACCAP